MFQRKEAWERASAGGGGEKSGGKSSKGAGHGGRDVASAAGGAVSLPPVEDMHPSWAARVKQQAAIKVTGIMHTMLKMHLFTGNFVRLSFLELFLCLVAGQS